MKETQTFRPPVAKLISDGWGRYFLNRKIYRARTSSFYPAGLPRFGNSTVSLYVRATGEANTLKGPMPLNLPCLHRAFPPSIYFYDVILLLILDHLFWGIGACILAPGGPRKAQCGHQRAFGAGSKMDCFSSLIEISSVKTSCGTPRISAIPEICPWELARSAAECRRRARCSHTLKTAGMLMHCDIALNVLALFAYELRQCALLCCFALPD